MRKILKKDIIIPAGTVMEEAPAKAERMGDAHVGCTVKLSDKTAGFFSYCLKEDLLEEWFDDVVDE